MVRRHHGSGEKKILLGWIIDFKERAQRFADRLDVGRERKKEVKNSF